MKIGNLFGLAANSLLVVLGVALIVFPVWWISSVIDTLPYFMESENSSMKRAIEDVFYTGEGNLYGSDIAPSIDYRDPRLADLPPQMTPELVAKFMRAQAIVNATISDARFAMQWAPMIVVILCAIGLVAVLLGVSLMLVQRKLDKILENKKG